MLAKVISGGQTGADRAALDAGLAACFPVGGLCPAGRLAEDGRIDERYPLEEIAGGYRQRTRRNVESSDGTAIFYQSELQGGSALTERFCQRLGKPCLLVDITQLSVAQAVDALQEFIGTHRVLSNVYATECVAQMGRFPEAIVLAVRERLARGLRIYPTRRILSL